jgi:SAM-dependent methyltransferase
MGIANIFSKKQVALKFEKSTYIPPEKFHEIADLIIKECSLESNDKVDILDIGSGTGRTILNILNRFYEKSINFKATCFDNSPKMLREFSENLDRFKSIKSFVNYFERDANLGLSAEFTNFNLVFIVSVLQYLDNWKDFLHQLYRKLSNDGYLIQAELIGWYQLLDGDFKDEEKFDPLSVEFWRKYFQMRKNYGEWEPEICFSKMTPVKKFCEEDLKMIKTSENDILWESEISWSDVLNWIKWGSVSSLGSGIKDRESLKKLELEMKLFLRAKSIDLEKNFSIEWGFNIFIFKKEKENGREKK